MVETRHVKLSYEEALDAKKQFLSSELNLLHTIRKLKNYKLLRRKEIAVKNNLKTKLASLKTKINFLAAPSS